MRPALILPEDFTKVVRKMREFFDSKGFLEVHTQNRLSILAACEDPETIATFDNLSYFSYTLENRQENIKQETSGTVTVEGNKYKLMYLGAEQLNDVKKHIL